jgi:hypothetical protein
MSRLSRVNALSQVIYANLVHPSYKLGLLSGLEMNEPNGNPRRYKWPWVVAAMVVLGIVLAVVWVTIAAKKIERERDWNAPAR